MREVLKRILRRFYLFGLAVAVRDRLRSLLFLRENLSAWINRASEDLPLPPLKLIIAVSGVPSIPWFLTSGRLAASSLEEILRKNGKDLSTFKEILDFGCGCGRVLRFLLSPGRNLYGVDINHKLVEWCNQNLPSVTARANQNNPPLNFEEERFDLIYALSVVTHMREETQKQWMLEFRRILKRGGFLILSTHGNAYLNDLTQMEMDLFQRGHVVTKNEGVEGGNRFAAYHPEKYVRETLSKGFQLIDFVKEGARGNPRQDLVLLRKAN